MQPFAAGASYRMGDLVFYDGSLYQADVNDPTGTPGSSADYNLVTVMGPHRRDWPNGSHRP